MMGNAIATQMLTVLACAALAVAGCERNREPGGHDDEHAGYGHEEHAANEEHGDDDHAIAHADEAVVRLSAAEAEAAGIRTARAGGGTIRTRLKLPGEIRANADGLAHIVPRAPGIVREVGKTLGERVRTDEVLAWIESDELAEAKLAFYAKQAEVVCCQIELPRARAIFENTNRLLALLEKEPTQGELHELDRLEMGEYRGRLVTAYAEHVATRTAYGVERVLHGKKISSKKEMVEAEAAFRKAQAQFVAAKDTARYQVLVAYSEAVRERQVAEFEAVAAEQRLRLKGADGDLVDKLRALVPRTAGLKPCLCNDPDCKEGQFPSVVDTLAKEKRFAWYALRAPFGGFVTEKHLTLGEKIGDEELVFTVADLSTVWAVFTIHRKDITRVGVGTEVEIAAEQDGPSATGWVAYVSPVMDEATRTATARIVLANPDGSWRPGTFVTGTAKAGERRVQVLVPKDAVQTVDGEDVVFVRKDDGCEAVHVQTGQSDGTRVEIVSGLRPGQEYVVEGAFELKAKIVTSGMDAHAGHGH